VYITEQARTEGFCVGYFTRALLMGQTTHCGGVHVYSVSLTVCPSVFLSVCLSVHKFWWCPNLTSYNRW